MFNIRLYRNLFLTIVILFSHSLFAQDAKIYPVVGEHGMVSTAHPLASEAALKILKEGGNAVDAAVAAAFAIGVVEPDGSGLGGGGAMTIYLKDEDRTYYIDFYQEAPSRVDEIEYSRKKDGMSAKTASIPGNLAGLNAALGYYGSMGLNEVLEDAIRYAGEGFEVDNTLAGIILDNIAVLQKYKETADVFLPDEFPLMEGDILKQEKLASTLKKIAKEGSECFYKGDIAKDIVEQINAEGNVFSLEDFENYEARMIKPLKGTYRGYDIYTANAPQSGVSILQTLNMV